MLRKLLILGICAGSSASVPILYQASPDTFHRLLTADSRQVTEEPVANVAIQSVTPKQQAAQPLGRSVRLDADPRGHFAGDFKLNGRKIGAVIDTGATLVALNVSTARKIGLKITQADFKYTVDTANGSTPAAAATIESLAIGRIHVENVQAVVLEDKALSDTLIGVSFLRRLSRYQVEGGSLVMTQ